MELTASTEEVVLDPEASVGERPKGAVIPKVSPAPSQSELVSNGVWIWMNSLSCQSALFLLPLSCSYRVSLPKKITANESFRV